MVRINHFAVTQKLSAHSVAGQIQRAREPVTAHPPKPCPAIISLGKGKRQCSGKK
jgi:hypothetical protein